MSNPAAPDGRGTQLPGQPGPGYPSAPGQPVAPAFGDQQPYPGQPYPGQGTPSNPPADASNTGPIEPVTWTPDLEPSAQGSSSNPVAPAPAPPGAAGPATEPPLTGSISPGPPPRRHSRAGAAWVALIVAAIVLVFLLIFITQNSGPVQVRYLGFEGTISLGVAMTFAAIAGALTAGLLGTVRILQLRSRAKRAASGR